LNATGTDDSQVLLLNDWVVRVWQPGGSDSQRIFLLLHGFTGDENSMTVFTRNLPGNAWIFSPRAPYHTKEGGYKWILSENGLTASFVEFLKTAVGLQEALSGWKKTFQLPDQKIEIAGFSQGAVMALTYALNDPGQIYRAACLSGFLPRDTPNLIHGEPLSGIPIFLAHGTEDKTVSFERAQQARVWLEQFGAQITVCDSPVGHRISAGCFRSFADFFREA